MFADDDQVSIITVVDLFQSAVYFIEVPLSSVGAASAIYYGSTSLKSLRPKKLVANEPPIWLCKCGELSHH